MSVTGYVKIPRSLYEDPLWKSLPLTYRHVYMTILIHMAFKETIQDDHGVLVIIKPGQFLTTERELEKLCDNEEIDRCLIQRALKKFKNLGFSIQTSIHKKTIITISREDIYELIDPNFDPNSIQTRSIKEEDKKEKKDLDDPKKIGKMEKIKMSDFTKDDAHFINLAQKKEWLPEEIEVAWKNYENSKKRRIIDNPVNYLDAIIKTNRAEKSKIQKLTKEKNLCQKTQEIKNTSKNPSEKNKGFYLGKDTSELPLAIYARQCGLSKR